MVKRFRVVDPRTGKVIGSYVDRARANLARDRLDNAFGAYRYRVERIEGVL
jgi:hypothetical protein